MSVCRIPNRNRECNKLEQRHVGPVAAARRFERVT